MTTIPEKPKARQWPTMEEVELSDEEIDAFREAVERFLIFLENGELSFS